ncbi:MAG TPA: trigger factor [Acidimicrobiales bacterium]|nr:trigger factor [Acidimicrobiales bacterium]
MKSAVESLEDNKVKVSVEVDETEFDKAMDAAFRRIAHEVRIPGFRPGKAPRRILEARIGTSAAREEALREALPEYYAQAVRENDVDVIAPPEIDITAGREEGPVAFDAVVEVRPKVSVPGYGGLRVEVPNPRPTDEEVDAQIERMRAQFAELEPANRPAIDTDQVTIDVVGSRDGEALPGLDATDYLYEVGSSGIVPELDDHLRGSKPGDILQFSARHPDPDEDPIDFRVLVKQVQQRVLPDLDDEWANEASEFDTLDALRADLVRRLTLIRAMQSQMALRERAATALGELVDEEVPEALVEDEMRTRLQDLGLRLQAQGISIEQYLAATGRSQPEFVEELRTNAREAAKVDLALRAVADAEVIEATDEEIDAEIERLAERTKQKPNQVRKVIERNGQIPELRSDLRKRKALEWIVEHVEVVDPEGHAIDRADLMPELEPTEAEASEAEAAEVEATEPADNETKEDE